ncbi:hypothetical protein PISMIDRAFT_685503, partial [Pisolithus microcarpus 441]
MKLPLWPGVQGRAPKISIRHDSMKRARLERQLGLQIWESQWLDRGVNSILPGWMIMSCSERSYNVFPGICIKDRQMSLASSPHRRVRSVH